MAKRKSFKGTSPKKQVTRGKYTKTGGKYSPGKPKRPKS